MSCFDLGRLGLLLAVATASLLAGVSDAQYRTDAELQQQSACMILPKQSPTVTYTPVGGFPADANGAPIFQGKIASRDLRILCADVFYDHSTAINATQATACLGYGYTIKICLTTVSTGAIDCNTTANEFLDYTLSGNAGQLSGSRDFSASAPFTVSLRWAPNASTPSSCYPMYLTAVVEEQDITPESPSSIVAVVVFVVIAAGVLIALAVFARYQIRKVLAKFGKKISAKPPRRSSTNNAANDAPPPTSIYDDPDQGDGIHIGYGGAQENMDEATFRQQYGEHAIRSHGAQQAELVDGVVVSSRPFVQPWYERSTFVSPADAKTTGASGRRKGDDEDGEVPQPQRTGRGGGRRGAPLAMQVAHIVPPAEGGSALRRRQPSPYQDDSVHNEAPLFMDTAGEQQAFHGDGGYGPGAAMHSPPAGNGGPRRLQFPSPVHVHAGGRGGGGVAHGAGGSTTPPPLRTLNPYDEYED